MKRVPASAAALAFEQLYSRYVRAYESKAMQRAGRSDRSPFSWGFEWLQPWEAGDVDAAVPAHERFCALSCGIVRNSDAFFAHERPSAFELTANVLRFASPVTSPWPENNIVHARWYPARDAKGRAVLVLPHWNAPPDAYRTFCRLLNLLGISALVVTLPCHGARRPSAASGAEYVVSANIGRTIACARQAVVDARSAVYWLDDRGHTRIGLVGTSLGSGYGFLTSAHEPRLRVNVFNHCASTISDVAWMGLPELRPQLESHLSQSVLRDAWSAINPISYFGQFARLSKISLLICGRYDELFPHACTREIITAFRVHPLLLAHRVMELPCGHYSMGWMPYAAAVAWRSAMFLREAL